MPRRRLCVHVAICLSLLTGMPPAASGAPAPPMDAYGDPLPAGAVARLGTVRLRHAGPVLCVVFSPDGKRLVSGGNDHAARVWDVETGRLVREFTDLPGVVVDALFSPDGQSVVAASSSDDGGVVTRRGVADGKDIWTYRGPHWPICMALSPDGKTLVGGGYDGMIRVWNWDTGEGTGRASVNAMLGTGCLAFSPDGGVLGTVDRQGTLSLWDWKAGKLLYSLSPGLCSLAFAPDGKRFVARDRSGAVARWDVQCGYSEFRLANKKCAQREGRSIAFAPDGATVAAAVDGAVYFWDQETGKELRHWDANPVAVTALAFAPDGKRLATAGVDGAIRVWDLTSGKDIHAFGSEQAGSVNALFIRGQRLAVQHGFAVSSVPSVVDEEHAKAAAIVQLWNFGAAGQTPATQATTFPPHWMLISPDGAYVALAAVDGGAMTLFSPSSGKELRRVGKSGEYYSAFPEAFSDDGKMLASTGLDVDPAHQPGEIPEQLRLWDANSGRLLRKIAHPYSRLGCVALSPDGQMLALSSFGFSFDGPPVSLYNASTGKELPCTVSDRLDDVYFFTFSPDSRELVIGATTRESEPRDAGILLLYELATGKRRLRIAMSAQTCAVVSPNGRWLASGGQNGDVRLWDLFRGRERAAFSGHRGRVNSLSFAPDGKTLASASADTTVLLWDVSESALPRPEDKPLTRPQQDACWADLADQDADRAFQAVAALTRSGTVAAAFLRERLRPVQNADPKRLARLIADLDGDDFTVREEACRRLAELEEAARPALEDARKHGLSPEAGRRTTELLDRLAQWPSAPERLRAVRAVEVLERLGTPEARRLLRELADGIPDAQQTREARAALDRLTRSSAPAP